jgi:hypothetical protein
MRTSATIVALILFASPAFAAPATAPAVFDLGGRRAVVTRLDALPYVESDYTRRFTFDSADNPKLKSLREKYRLDEVVAPGKDEFDRQILLLDWVNRRFAKFGRPSSAARGALDILQAIDDGHTFFCAQYADVFVSAAASMGWVDRALALRRPDHIGSGSTEHTSTEIWSNQYRKWVMLDPTFAMYVEKDGIPLSAWELREEWFRHDGKNVTFVLGKERKRFHKSDIPVFRKTFPGFGDLKLDGGALNVYAFIGYIPNTNLMDAGPDYGKMFITQDEIGGATKWHKRVVPKDPAHEPYFPINQAAVTLAAEGDHLRVTLKTMTPNFERFETRFDGGEWRAVDGDSIPWPPHEGKNTLEVRTINAFGVAGPVSTVEAEYRAE